MEISNQKDAVKVSNSYWKKSRCYFLWLDFNVRHTDDLQLMGVIGEEFNLSNTTGLANSIFF